MKVFGAQSYQYKQSRWKEKFVLFPGNQWFSKQVNAHLFASTQTEIQGVFGISVKTKAVCSLIINL